MSSFERTMPKIEILDLDLPSDDTHSRHIGENVASSSGSNLRSSFIAMGFSQYLVDKVIEEKGEDDVDLLLETLFEYSALQEPQSECSGSLNGFFSDKQDVIAADCRLQEVIHKQYPESSDSLECLFGDDRDTSCSTTITGHIGPKEEPDVLDEVHDDRRASLLMMNFSLDDINFAMSKLGKEAPIHELVDFIFAAQIAEDEDDTHHGNGERNEETTTESLFGTMEKTLRLLELGFSENQISAAIEMYGSEVPVSELADAICADEISGTCYGKNKRPSHYFDPFTVKTEEYCAGTFSGHQDFDLEKYKGKMPKEEYDGESSSLKRPKQEHNDESSIFPGPAWLETRKGDSKFPSPINVPQRELGLKAGRMDRFGLPKLAKPKPCMTADKIVRERPFFFYGQVINLSEDCWRQISKFLYEMDPEFVNTHFFSALSRKEGYIHNLPTENRFHILPKPPMNIEEAIPHTKKWWPSWDSRKQLSCINYEITGITLLCDRLGKMLTDSKGLLSAEQLRDLLHQCRKLNLVWVGNNKLAPIEPEHIERIMGYPLHHTRAPGFGLEERLESLKHSFQIDTLGYHLSVLRSLFPGGLSVLSIYSGLGGAEISLHRVGIRLNGVVSVEPCGTKRKILKNWWQNTEQTGELVQIEDIHTLSSNKLESLIKKFGGFDIVICQNPYFRSSKHPVMVADGDEHGDFEFNLFYEFVRILQRVRSTMERSR